jgi:serine/threonine protein phosphatase 1
MLAYAIADLHGRLDLLEAAFGAITAHADGREHKVITLGDYVDHGPQSRETIQYLMDAQAAGRPLICLKGNHEDVMVRTLRTPLDPDWWIRNGGGSTLASYGHPRRGAYCRSVVPHEHLAWLDALPLLHVDRQRVFVHAGVDPTVALDEQKEQVLLWRVYPDGFAVGHGNRHVVHGHEQFADGPRKLCGRTDLDTLAWVTGRLVIGVFDDDVAGGPVDYIEVQERGMMATIKRGILAAAPEWCVRGYLFAEERKNLHRYFK